MEYQLRLTERQHSDLRKHLLPRDGKEAVAILLCGRCAGDRRHVLTARRIVPVPYSACRTREKRKVTWSTDVIDSVLSEVTRHHLAIVKVHSHPEDVTAFSEIDDTSDQRVFEAVHSLLDDGLPHASAVMLPDGTMFGRAVEEGEPGSPLSSTMVVGDDISIWHGDGVGNSIEEFARRHAQVFGRGTTSLLRRLSVAVVGCSGTGSIVTEQLARLGVGRLVLVDPDTVEEKNLNRILNASKEDAYLNRPKVHVMASAIARMGLGQEVQPLWTNLDSKEAVKAVAQCDMVFGCMDGTEGRQLLNRLATYYTMPYFDVGVCLEADGCGGIDTVAGAVHYLQPGLSTLMDREVFNSGSVRAEEERRRNPELYEQHKKEGYIRGVREDRPAVISVNMLAASLAVNDFLARIHPYRNNPNQEYACIQINLAEVAFIPESEPEAESTLVKYVGWGDTDPLLGRPSLS